MKWMPSIIDFTTRLTMSGFRAMNFCVVFNPVCCKTMSISCMFNSTRKPMAASFLS